LTKINETELYLMPPDMVSVAFMAFADLGKGTESIYEMENPYHTSTIGW
jgi:hypothetical protein